MMMLASVTPKYMTASSMTFTTYASLHSSAISTSFMVSSSVSGQSSVSIVATPSLTAALHFLRMALSLAISSRQPLWPQVSHLGPLMSTTMCPASPALAFSPVIIRFFTNRGQAIP